MTDSPDAKPQVATAQAETAQAETSQPRSEAAEQAAQDAQSPGQPKEIGGQAGPEPTRFGDWEKKGRCTDF